jgi:hypothetical protein
MGGEQALSLAHTLTHTRPHAYTSKNGLDHRQRGDAAESAESAECESAKSATSAKAAKCASVLRAHVAMTVVCRCVCSIGPQCVVVHCSALRPHPSQSYDFRCRYSVGSTWWFACKGDTSLYITLRHVTSCHVTSRHIT